MTSLKFFKFFLVSLIALSMFTSCSKEEMEDDLMGEEYSVLNGDGSLERDDDDEEEEIEFDMDCFDFVYPVSIQFPDGTTQSFDEYDTLDEAIEKWEDANIDPMSLPMPVYPVSITLEDGTVSEFTSNEQFLELLTSCEDDD